MLSAPQIANTVSAARVERVGARSEVTGLKSHSPLRVLTPSNHGHAAWLFLSSLGGGFVGGDSVSLEIWRFEVSASPSPTRPDSEPGRHTRVHGNYTPAADMS